MIDLLVAIASALIGSGMCVLSIAFILRIIKDVFRG